MRAAPFPEIHGFGSLPPASGRARTQKENGIYATPNVHRRQTPLHQTTEAKLSAPRPTAPIMRVHQPSYKLAERLGLARVALGAKPYTEHFRILRGHPEAGTLLLYLGISFSFTTFLLLYALWSRSVGLMSASFHNYFHCLVLCVSLAAIAASHQHNHQHYTYGIERGHILAAFTNGIFLVFMSLFFVMEALHHLTSNQHHHHDESLWVWNSELIDE